MVLDGLGIGLGHLGRSGRCFAEGLLEIQVDDNGGSGAFRRRRPKQRDSRTEGPRQDVGLFPRCSRTVQLDVSRRRRPAVQGEQGARFPDAARPGLVTQCKEDGMHTEAQDSWRNRDRGRWLRSAGANGGGGGGSSGGDDDAWGRGFLLDQGLRIGSRGVQSTAQCLARGRTGRQRPGPGPGWSRRDQVNFSNGRLSTAVASQPPVDHLGRALGHLGSLIDYCVDYAAGVGWSWSAEMVRSVED